MEKHIPPTKKVKVRRALTNYITVTHDITTRKRSTKVCVGESCRSSKRYVYNGRGARGFGVWGVGVSVAKRSEQKRIVPKGDIVQDSDEA